ncbi:uncharacterized protein LOC115300729 [Suricata suricatta]|uniref:uncharacterized protein LOC115300729 n=1 Tax=Suricata suricatta TaxID=37032 RepID=UPI0011559B27|nr:uncharacterized protein LOC115300729 [Suricata suricatta]XP_029806093.1 uncharacterized protein LOC115300729 [Suricata suricatta]
MAVSSALVRVPNLPQMECPGLVIGFWKALRPHRMAGSPGLSLGWGRFGFPDFPGHLALPTANSTSTHTAPLTFPRLTFHGRTPPHLPWLCMCPQPPLGFPSRPCPPRLSLCLGLEPRAPSPGPPVSWACLSLQPVRSLPLPFLASGLWTEETWPLLSLNSWGHAEQAAGDFPQKRGGEAGCTHGDTEWLRAQGLLQEARPRLWLSRKAPRGQHPIWAWSCGQRRGGEGAPRRSPQGWQLKVGGKEGGIRFQILSDPHFASFPSLPCSNGLCPKGQAFYLWSIYFILVGSMPRAGLELMTLRSRGGRLTRRATQTPLRLECSASRGLMPPAWPTAHCLWDAAQVTHQPHLFCPSASSRGNVGVPSLQRNIKKFLFRIWETAWPHHARNLSPEIPTPAKLTSAIHFPYADFSLCHCREQPPPPPLSPPLILGIQLMIE